MEDRPEPPSHYVLKTRSALPARLLAARPVWARKHCITIIHAVARLVYGATFDGRYNQRGGNYLTGAEARSKRQSDLMQLTKSGLPGTKDFSGPKRWAGPDGAKQLIRAQIDWQRDDDAKWSAAEEQIIQARNKGELQILLQRGDECHEMYDGILNRTDISGSKADDLLLLAATFNQWLSKSSDKPPLDISRARIFLMGLKYSGKLPWSVPPTERQLRAFLIPEHYSSASSEALRAVMRSPSLWPNAKRGRRRLEPRRNFKNK